MEHFPTDMRLSELYRLSWREARRLQREADVTDSFSNRFVVREASVRQESISTGIAHCLALWGDLKLCEIVIQKSLRKVRRWTCGGGNPWRTGLRRVEDVSKYGFFRP